MWAIGARARGALPVTGPSRSRRTMCVSWWPAATPSAD